jgi:hypothetical protein
MKSLGFWAYTAIAVFAILTLLVVLDLTWMLGKEDQWVMINRSEDGAITVLFMPDNETRHYSDSDFTTEVVMRHLRGE